jgi:hypothetical protein
VLTKNIRTSLLGQQRIGKDPQAINIEKKKEEKVIAHYSHGSKRNYKLSIGIIHLLSMLPNRMQKSSSLRVPSE